MKNLTCEKCGKSVAESTVFCPDCGAAIFHAAPSAPSAPPPRPPVPVQEPMELAPEKYDFKKLIPPAAVVLAVILALILGWNALSGIFAPGNDPQLSTQPSTQQTSPSTAPTQKPTETITPTQPTITVTEPIPTEPDLSWVVTTSHKMSYEEFFSEDRPLYGVTNNTSWVGDDGNTYTIDNLLQIFRDGKLIYTVPGADQLAEKRKLLTADGTYVYIEDEYNLMRIDLLTGDVKECISLSNPFSSITQGPDLIYFCAASPDYMLISRYYVPTHTIDILHRIEDAATPETWFSLSIDPYSSSLGDITWTMINPEMHWFLYDEMQNPDSKYRTMEYPHGESFSKYWEDPRLLSSLPYNITGATLLQTVQDDTGICALLQGTYHCADGTYTERKGVVDDCWFGSGKGHDHWNPELTADIPPTILNAEAIPVSGIAPPSDEMAENIRQEGYGEENKLYKIGDYYNSSKSVKIYQDGEYRTASHLPHIDKRNVLINCKYYSYYASVDNTLIRLGLDGNVSVIYTAKYGDLRTTCYYDGNLYFRDGDTIVMIDTVDCTSRELLSHPGNIYVDYDDYDQKLYIETVLGLAVNAYLFDPITGTLEDTTPHL